MYDGGSDYDYGDPYGDPYGGYGEPQPSGGMQMPNFSGVSAPKVDIKKFMPLIIVGVIVLVILGAVMFYLGSQHTVTFNINEKDAGPLSARLEIENPDGTSVFRQSTTSSEQVTLFAGEYDIKVLKSGYAPYTRTINVPADTEGGNFVIKLYKDLDAELIVSIEEGVNSLYGTRMVNGIITIENKEKAIQQEKLFASSEDLKVLFPGDELNSFPISVSPQGSKSVSFQIGMEELPEDEDMDVEVEFYIKGTDISETLSLKANPSPEIEVSFRDNEEDVKAGDDEANLFEVDVSNEGDFDARDIVIDIVPDEGYEDRMNWFEFNDYDVNKYSYIIKTLKEDTEVTAILLLKIPADVEIGTEFRGRMIINSVTFEERQVINLYYTVSDKVISGIEVDLEGDGKEFKGMTDVDFTVENVGEFDIENVTLEVVNYQDCDFTWIEFLSDLDGDFKVETGLLKKKGDPVNADEKRFDVRILPGIPITDLVDCQIRWTYTDPITDQLVVDTEIYTIRYDRPDPEA